MIKTAGDLIEALEHTMTDDPNWRDRPVMLELSYTQSGETEYTHIQLRPASTRKEIINVYGTKIEVYKAGNEQQIISISA